MTETKEMTASGAESTVASGTERNRIVWLDVVRFVAMFTVVCCHCADPFNFYAGDSTSDLESIKFWGAAWGSILRPCVPLFVMITGALLLPVREDAWPFYRKRISRVFWPFLIWSVIYCLFPWISGLFGAGRDSPRNSWNCSYTTVHPMS